MTDLNEKAFDAARKAYHQTQIYTDGYDTLRAAISAYLDATEPSKPVAEAVITMDMIDRLVFAEVDDVVSNSDGGAPSAEKQRALDLEKKLAREAIMSALSTPPRPEARGDKGGEAFSQIVAARKTVIDATAAYNARLSVARAERDRGNWSIKVDPEYHAMCDAQSAFHRTVQDLADAALIQEQKKDG
jgi:hypothetical protein